MKLLLVAVGLACLAATCSASCFGRDAHFNPANAKPTVTQPSRNDPTKVMVDWSKILTRPECVDGYAVLVYPDGMPATSAVRYDVDGNTKSKIIDTQPCVGFRYVVEMKEKGALGMKAKQSGDQLFKTAGSTSSLRLQPSNFHVSYVWDPISKVTNLRQASISIQRDMIPGASCLDYIQVTGHQLRSSSSSSRPPIGASRSRTFSWDHLGQNKYNPSISVGGASTLPASISRSPSSSSSSSSYSGAVRQSGPVTRSMSSSGNAITEPQYANTLPRASGGASHQVGPIKVQPPFINATISIVVPVTDCAEYEYELKFVAPAGKELGKVSGIKLPSLANDPGYVPPPITSVMSISYGNTGKPTYGVKTASGVNAACLPSYFEAYDAYVHRLENEVTWMGREGNRVQSLVSNTQDQLSASQEELLRKAGCVCTSPHLNFSSTDLDLNHKYGSIMGHYEFKGMHANHPFYKLIDNGHTNSSQSTSGSRPNISTPPPRPVAEQYLFWYEKDKQWLFAPTLGKDSGVEFGSVERSLAKCPGDPPARDMWQYKSSVLHRWKKSTGLKVVCQVGRH